MMIIYDDRMDVLYIKRDDAVIKTSREHPIHSDMVFSLDVDGNMVGVTIINAMFITSADLATMNEDIPDDLFDAIDKWIMENTMIDIDTKYSNMISHYDPHPAIKFKVAV